MAYYCAYIMTMSRNVDVHTYLDPINAGQLAIIAPWLFDKSPDAVFLFHVSIDTARNETHKVSGGL